MLHWREGLKAVQREKEKHKRRHRRHLLTLEKPDVYTYSYERLIAELGEHVLAIRNTFARMEEMDKRRFDQTIRDKLAGRNARRIKY